MSKKMLLHLLNWIIIRECKSTPATPPVWFCMYRGRRKADGSMMWWRTWRRGGQLSELILIAADFGALLHQQKWANYSSKGATSQQSSLSSSHMSFQSTFPYFLINHSDIVVCLCSANNAWAVGSPWANKYIWNKLIIICSFIFENFFFYHLEYVRALTAWLETKKWLKATTTRRRNN